MYGLTINTPYSYFKNSHPSLACSKTDIKNPNSSFICAKQEDDFIEKSVLEQGRPEYLPDNIRKMYEDGDDKVKEIIFLLFFPIKKPAPLAPISCSSQENIQEKELNEKHYSLQPYQKSNNVLVKHWPIISNLFSAYPYPLSAYEQHIEQEISQWKTQWQIATSLVKNKYVKDFSEAKLAISDFLKKYPRYNKKINRNNFKYGTRYKNLYVHLISKALRYGLTKKEDITKFILIKTNFKVGFKTVCNNYYEYKELASKVTFADEKDKIDIYIKRVKYISLIKNYKNEIYQNKKIIKKS